jgi:hypothetical protein
MKLLPFIFASSVLGQSALIMNSRIRDRNVRYSKFRCHSNLDDISWGIKADDDVYVEFYSSDDCRGHWKRKAWGRTRFRNYVYYGSIRLTRRERRYYGYGNGNGNSNRNSFDSSEDGNGEGGFDDSNE